MARQNPTRHHDDRGASLSPEDKRRRACDDIENELFRPFDEGDLFDFAVPRSRTH